MAKIEKNCANCGNAPLNSKRCLTKACGGYTHENWTSIKSVSKVVRDKNKKQRSNHVKGR